MKYYYHERIIVINKCFALVILQTIWFLFGEYAHLIAFLFSLVVEEYYAEACNYPFILFSLAFRFPFFPSQSQVLVLSSLYSNCFFRKRETLHAKMVLILDVGRVFFITRAILDVYSETTERTLIWNAKFKMKK